MLLLGRDCCKLPVDVVVRLSGVAAVGIVCQLKAAGIPMRGWLILCCDVP